MGMGLAWLLWVVVGRAAGQLGGSADLLEPSSFGGSGAGANQLRRIFGRNIFGTDTS